MINVTVETLLEALPAVLREDSVTLALATSVAQELHELCCNTDVPILYAAIDSMDEKLLDILAQDFKIDWWRPNANVDEKRETLKSSWYVHRHLGTKAAVERAVASFLGQGIVEEWNEYGGEPFHFRISGGNAYEIQSGIRTFLSVLEHTKRGSAILDKVTALIEYGHTVCVGFAMRTGKIRIVPCAETTEEYTYLTDDTGNTLVASGRVLVL